MPLDRLLCTAALAFVLVMVFVIRGSGWGFVFLAFTGWSFSFFGDDLAAVLNLPTEVSAAAYVRPFVRGLGWLLLTAAAVIVAARHWNWFA